MTTRSNIHAHCTYCDGKNTIEEMIQAAIKSNLISFGFSSHAHTDYDFDDCQVMDVDGYFNELEAMKQKYRDQIIIFKGMELESLVKGPNGGDVLPEIDPRCDFTIGSCHLTRPNGKYFCIDYKPEMLDDAIKEFGSVENFIDDYFTGYLSFVDAVPFDVVGHIDLYTKFNEKHPILDQDSKKYQNQVLHYIDQIVKYDRIFEVNTGAISRGYRSTPYPHPFILKRLLEKKAPVMITSDTHSVNSVTCCFDETERLLKDIGFTEQMQLTEKGFVSVPL